jgi:hypothetical protein
MKVVEELAGRLARVQGGKTVNKNTERMYGARRTLRRVHVIQLYGIFCCRSSTCNAYRRNLRSTGVCEDARAFGSYDGAARAVRRCVW